MNIMYGKVRAKTKCLAQPAYVCTRMYDKYLTKT